jgi:hypothetical protein
MSKEVYVNIKLKLFHQKKNNNDAVTLRASFKN